MLWCHVKECSVQFFVKDGTQKAETVNPLSIRMSTSTNISSVFYLYQQATSKINYSISFTHQHHLRTFIKFIMAEKLAKCMTVKPTRFCMLLKCWDREWSASTCKSTCHHYSHFSNLTVIFAPHAECVSSLNELIFISLLTGGWARPRQNVRPPVWM